MEDQSERRRGPYAKTAARRTEILRTALEVFGEQGFRGSSMRDIAERVGLSESGLLHHFGGKVELLQAVLAERDEETARGGYGPGHLTELVARNRSRRGVVRLFVTLSAEATDPDHPAHDYFVRRYERVRGQQADFVRALQRTGRLPPDADPELVSQLLLAVMDGLQIQWLLDPDRDMVAAFECFAQLILDRFPAGGGSAGEGRAEGPPAPLF